MVEHGSVRNLEQIQENDGEGRTPRGVTILLVGLGGACIVFAGLALGGRRGAAPAQKVDPLGDLVTQQAKIGGASPILKATDLSTHDVTFPGILSDEASPTTALAAVRNAARPGSVEPQAALALSPHPGNVPVGSIQFGSTPVGAGAAASSTGGSPPPATDRLPVVPLPAQNVLEASPVVTRPRDALTRAASDAAQVAQSDKPPAAAGREGGYQLQVSSFRTQAEGDHFAVQLRARGHKAYVLEAHVPGRGTWYRVRVGPFPSQHAAAAYRSGFETREHVVPFIVPPQK